MSRIIRVPGAYKHRSRRMNPEPELRMIDSFRTAMAVVAASSAVACGDATGPDGISLAELVGVWEATEISVTNELDPTLMEDLYALGVRWEMSVAADGAFAVSFSNPFGSDGFDGTVTVEGDSLVLLRASDDTPPGPPLRETIHYAPVAGDLQLTWQGTEQCGSYGWSAPECPIPVTFRMRIARREASGG